MPVYNPCLGSAAVAALQSPTLQAHMLYTSLHLPDSGSTQRLPYAAAYVLTLTLRGDNQAIRMVYPLERGVKMTKQWTYQTARATLLGEIFRQLSINQVQRDTACLQFDAIMWEALFLYQLEQGVSPREALQTMLEDKEVDPNRRSELLQLWETDSAAIEARFPTDDSKEAPPADDTVSSLLDHLRERLGATFGYYNASDDSTERRVA